MLELTLVAIGALLLVVLLSRLVGGGDRVSGAEARKIVDGGALLVDVRTPQEFASGHIDGAISIPVQELEGRLSQVGPKERPVVVYCRSGARSGRAARTLRRSGYTDVHNLGPASAW